MPRILVTGGSGRLGAYVAEQAAESGWEVWATCTSHEVEIPGCRVLPLDLTGPVSFYEIRPDVVVHTAAVSAPDACEQDKPAAFAINALGTAHVAKAAEEVGAHLVHLSTDLLFDGQKNPICEDDQICPPNYYGLTKACAEAAVRASRAPWACVRTTLIYGPRKFSHQESFSDKVIDALSAGREIGAFVDQYRPAIPAWNLADVLLEIAERRLTGVYHAACPEVISRYQFAHRIAEVFGLDPGLVRPIYMDETEALAVRPKMLVLSTARTSRALRTRLQSFEEGIAGLRSRTA
ncbi:MAG: SDR family oxidoreductase [Armatimonadota bacterium]